MVEEWTSYMAGAAQVFWIDGFESSLRGVKYLNLGSWSAKISSFYWIFPKIDGFENPPLEIDGFGQTHRTHAKGATDV